MAFDTAWRVVKRGMKKRRTTPSQTTLKQQKKSLPSKRMSPTNRTSVYLSSCMKRQVSADGHWAELSGSTVPAHTSSFCGGVHRDVIPVLGVMGLLHRSLDLLSFTCTAPPPMLNYVPGKASWTLSSLRIIPRIVGVRESVCLSVWMSVCAVEYECWKWLVSHYCPVTFSWWWCWWSWMAYAAPAEMGATAVEK